MDTASLPRTSANDLPRSFRLTPRGQQRARAPANSPAHGALSLPSLSGYMPKAASGLNSRNGVPGSSNICTRSRGSSFPRAVWRARATSPPPS